MSPCESAPEGDLLERPEEAFAYYRDRGVSWVVCEEKHMGSRLIAVACRDEQAAFERFGVRSSVGACYTRLGRPFFPNRDVEKSVLNEIRAAMDRNGLWDKLQTNWICLDCELMPWSAKASGLLQRQYAGTGRAGRMTLRAETHELVMASSRGWVEGRNDPAVQEPDQQTLKEMAGRWHCREAMMEQYVEAYRRYCWPTDGLKGLKLAPFHIMATEGQVHVDRSHLWHMARAKELAAASELIVPTNFRYVTLDGQFPHGTDIPDGTDIPVVTTEGASAWWHEMTTKMTEAGDVADVEGMVVKPIDFTPPQDSRPMRDPRVAGLIQPALKCRGREYLRIIYGPEYTAQLEKLRKRGLGTKRRAAIQEFALGIEGLERFVRKEPLSRVHECAFAVLALECEPLDPRL
jgi:protein phosphatase